MTSPPRHSLLLDGRFVTVWVATLGFWYAVFAHVPLIPLYLDHLGYGTATIGLVYGSGALCALTARIACGWAVDRYGERPFLLAGALLWAVTAPVPPLTDSLLLIELSWLAKGVGLGLFTTAAAGWVARYAPTHQRGTAMGWWGTANSLAMVAAPVIAVLVRDLSGYPLAFGTTAIAAAVAAAAVCVPSTVGGGASPRPRARWQTVWERRAVEPGLFGLVLGLSASAFTVFVPLRVEAGGLGNPGLLLAVYAISGVLARIVAGPVSDRRGRGVVIIAGLLACAAGSALLMGADQLALALTAALLFGAGVGATSPGLLAWNADRVSAARRGVASSTYFSLHEIGLFAGAWATGMVLALLGPAAFGLVAATLLISVAAYLRQRRAAGEPVSAPERESTEVSR